jgi:hypothetical protein
MILQLEMPPVNPSIRGGQIVAWHKDEGEFVGYGDPVCDVLFTNAVHLRRTTRGGDLADGAPRSRTRRRLRTLNKIEVMVRLVASDTGYLRRVCAGGKDQNEPGSVLAILSTEPAETLPEVTGSDRWPLFRVVADQVEEEV